MNEKPAQKSTRRAHARAVLHRVIFESDTPAGKGFDVLLILAIVVSVLVTVLDSVPAFRESHGLLLFVLEWGFTALFAVEYGLRLYSARHPKGYALSFFGLVDLIGWLPTVVGLLIPGSHFLTTFRVIRVLRIFRILKMVAYIEEAESLMNALRSGHRKILIFLGGVLTLVMILGSLMYLIEGPENGFTSIPVSIYWAIVTLTTVGYGDISPQTPAGQFLSSVVMILGYAIIAVPTGIVSAEFIRQGPPESKQPRCPQCGEGQHLPRAKYCHQCGMGFGDVSASEKADGV
ncbi:MAG: ion transporter [Verrucomicrobia bacterium]|nr:ion transporter [Verrucomicrobiota bacterium]MCH8513161.1 ion transporter [Kiritimatiellia bacterium]